MKQVIVFGGASEQHTLLEALLSLGLMVTLSVVSHYGRALLPAENERFRLLASPLDMRQMADLLHEGNFCCLIDATHPYAVAASANIRAAAAQAGLPCLRLLREQSDLSGCVVVDSTHQAVAELNRRPGAALLTTGSKDLPLFAGVNDYQLRLYARVLPAAESIVACTELGLPASHIIAMQGPFSAALNTALMREFKIKTLVTKDGGAAGGFGEKLAAARELGITAIVIQRPVETGLTLAELLPRVAELAGVKQ